MPSPGGQRVANVSQPASFILKHRVLPEALLIFKFVTRIFPVAYLVSKYAWWGTPSTVAETKPDEQPMSAEKQVSELVGAKKPGVGLK